MTFWRVAATAGAVSGADRIRRCPAPVGRMGLPPRAQVNGAAYAGGLRFAFYGRVSTEDHQDPATSRAWQRLRADAVASGHGRIVAEFFDVGHSRSLP
ncbi:hypothetical protein ACU686_16310 [Yinghuangia aomiensis]